MSEITEAQLSFQVTKRWLRPDGEAGWTEMTAQGPLRQMIGWMLAELPPAAWAQDGSPSRQVIMIDWGAAGDGILHPEGITHPDWPGRMTEMRAMAEKLANLADYISSAEDGRGILRILDEPATPAAWTCPCGTVNRGDMEVCTSCGSKR